MTNATSTLNRIAAIIFTAIVLFIATPDKAFAIINGDDAVAGEQGWMVAVTLADETDGYMAQFCGGTLIANNWVLTAAHCTYDMNGAEFNAADLNVIIGRNTLSSNNGERIAVSQIVRHTGFSFNTYNNDIALLKLETATDAPVVTLATAANNSESATVFGWGVTESGNGAQSLRTVDLPTVSKQDCVTAYAAYGRTISNNMLCAGFADGGQDACTGDSGGPLVVENSSGETVQTGVVSWGEGCAQAGAFGVYTSVANYASWITIQMMFNA